MKAAKGKLTRAEKMFADTYAVTGDRAYSAAKAGYSSPMPRASQNLAKPEIQAEIIKEQTARLVNEALPAAVNCLVSIISDAKAPAGARVQASKVVLDRVLGLEGGAGMKEPHEMNRDELAKAIAELEAVAADRAKQISPPIVEDAQIIPDTPDIFE